MLHQVMYDKKAFRFSEYNVAKSVGDIHPGQLFQLNDDSEWEYADGTRKAYPTLNKRYPGKGYGSQNERIEGRDDVTQTGKISCLSGNFEIATDQFDKQAAFKVGDALYPSTDAAKKGLLTKFDSSNAAHKVQFIAGFVTKLPNKNNGLLKYHG